MRRQITVTNNPAPALPAGLAWLKSYRTRTGSPLGTNEYYVRSDAGGMRTAREPVATLTEARALARRIVRGGKAWAEVFRIAESGVSSRDVWIASYEVETESGATL